MVYGVVILLLSLRVPLYPIDPLVSDAKAWGDGFGHSQRTLHSTNTSTPGLTVAVTLSSNESIAVGSSILTKVSLTQSQAYAQDTIWRQVSVSFQGTNLTLQYDGQSWVGEKASVYDNNGTWKAQIVARGEYAVSTAEGNASTSTIDVTMPITIPQTAISETPSRGSSSPSYWPATSPSGRSSTAKLESGRCTRTCAARTFDTLPPLARLR